MMWHVNKRLEVCAIAIAIAIALTNTRPQHHFGAQRVCRISRNHVACMHSKIN